MTVIRREHAAPRKGVTGLRSPSLRSPSVRATCCWSGPAMVPTNCS